MSSMHNPCTTSSAALVLAPAEAVAACKSFRASPVIALRVLGLTSTSPPGLLGVPAPAAGPLEVLAAGGGVVAAPAGLAVAGVFAAPVPLVAGVFTATGLASGVSAITRLPPGAP